MIVHLANGRERATRCGQRLQTGMKVLVLPHARPAWVELVDARFSTFVKQGEAFEEPCEGCMAVWMRQDELRADRPAMVAYVTSRFYPPLPREYGPLAARAVQAWRAGRPDWLLPVGHLAMVPRNVTRMVGAEHQVVRADALVLALRLGHLIEDDEL